MIKSLYFTVEALLCTSVLPTAPLIDPQNAIQSHAQRAGGRPIFHAFSRPFPHHAARAKRFCTTHNRNALRHWNTLKIRQRQQQYTPIVHKIAKELNISPALLDAVIMAESQYIPRARSPRGAMGLMQLMPVTAKRYGVLNPFDPEQNIRGGARFLRDLLQRFDTKLELVLAAYNAGTTAVIRAGYTIPNYKETKAYVPKVLATYHSTINTIQILQ